MTRTAANWLLSGQTELVGYRNNLRYAQIVLRAAENEPPFILVFALWIANASKVHSSLECRLYCRCMATVHVPTEPPDFHDGYNWVHFEQPESQTEMLRTFDATNWLRTI